MPPKSRAQSRAEQHDTDPDDTVTELPSQTVPLAAPQPQSYGLFTSGAGGSRTTFGGFSYPPGSTGQTNPTGETRDRNTIELSDIYSLLMDIQGKIDVIERRQHTHSSTLADL